MEARKRPGGKGRPHNFDYGCPERTLIPEGLRKGPGCGFKGRFVIELHGNIFNQTVRVTTIRFLEDGNVRLHEAGYPNIRHAIQNLCAEFGINQLEGGPPESP